MTTFIRNAAEDVLAIEAHELPQSVRTKAGICLLDFLGACLDGVELPWARQAIAAGVALGSGGTGRILAHTARMGAAEAAFVNATLGGATSQMDTFADSATHPGVAIIPAVLAGAELAGSRGDDVLCAIVAGYQIMARLGTAMYGGATTFKARPTAIVGPVAAAAALGRLVRMSETQIVYAMALAANTAAGLMEWANRGTMDLTFHAGTAARNALSSWQLAMAGAVAADTILDGPHGLMATFDTGRTPPPRRDAASVHEILHVIHKPVPACIFVQSPSQVAMKIVGQRDLRIQDIDTIRIRVHPTARGYPGCDNWRLPKDAQTARMSIQYAVSSVLRSRSLSARNWAAPFDPDIAAWLKKCQLSTFSDTESACVRACVVEVLLRDGTVIAEAADDFHSASDDRLRRRFEESAARRLRPGMTARIESYALSLEALANIEPLLQSMQAIQGTNGD